MYDEDLLREIRLEIQELNTRMSVLQSDLNKLLDSEIPQEPSERYNELMSDLENSDVLVRLMSFISDSDSPMLTRAFNQLFRAGVYTIADLKLLDLYTVSHIRCIGPQSMAAFIAWQKDRLLNLPKKCDKGLVLPVFNVGDVVETRVSNDVLPAGSRALIKVIYPITKAGTQYYRALPVFSCEGIGNGRFTVFYSVSEIRKV